MRCASRGRRRSTSPPGSSGTPAKKTRRRSASSSPSAVRFDLFAGHAEKFSFVPFVAAWCIFGRRRGMMQTPNTYRAGPDPRGHFGLYGGRYVAETLMPLILAVEQAYDEAKDDPNFHAELDYYLEHYVGRPSPLYFAERLTRYFGGAKLYLKRDELNHTGAHKINNVLG